MIWFILENQQQKSFRNWTFEKNFLNIYCISDTGLFMGEMPVWTRDASIFPTERITSHLCITENICLVLRILHSFYYLTLPPPKKKLYKKYFHYSQNQTQIWPNVLYRCIVMNSLLTQHDHTVCICSGWSIRLNSPFCLLLQDTEHLSTTNILRAFEKQIVFVEEKGTT